MSRSRDALEAVFDRRADSYVRSEWHVQYARRLVQLAPPGPGARVLDAAAGTGFAALAASEAIGTSGRVVAVDISAGMLEKARQAIASRHVSNIELIQGDATCLNRFPDASFDMVICSAGLLYMPVHAALREWRRLLTADGRVGFSTMREGFPVAARLFREHAAAFGLSLADPATALGDEIRCRRLLREAGFTPSGVVAESVRFSPADLEQAWQAHIRGPHHDTVSGLTPSQISQFRSAYTAALARLLRDDEYRVRDAEVIYAFGRKRAPDRVRMR